MKGHQEFVPGAANSFGLNIVISIIYVYIYIYIYIYIFNMQIFRIGTKAYCLFSSSPNYFITLRVDLKSGPPLRRGTKTYIYIYIFNMQIFRIGTKAYCLFSSSPNYFITLRVDLL